MIDETTDEIDGGPGKEWTRMTNESTQPLLPDFYIETRELRPGFGVTLAICAHDQDTVDLLIKLSTPIKKLSDKYIHLPNNYTSIACLKMDILYIFSTLIDMRIVYRLNDIWTTDEDQLGLWIADYMIT